MSQSVQVKINGAGMPTFEQWQAAIASAEFPLEFKDIFDPLNGPGVVCCSYNGADTQFEYYFDGASGEPADFRTNSRFGDTGWAAASAAAAVLASVTNGVLYDPQSGERRRGRKALEWARSGPDDSYLERLALALPHVDSEFDQPQQSTKRPWWRFW